MPAWMHDLNPFVVRFSDTFGVRWYGLAYVTGFALGWWVLTWIAKRRLTPLSVQRVSDAVMMMIVGVVVGGRLGYCVFYKPQLLVSFDHSFPWWGVLKINQGGMASHGGLIGVIAACWFVSRGRRSDDGTRAESVPFLHVTDLMALVSPIGLGLGRIANFINGELLGEIVAMPGKPAPWWAVKFPQELLSENDPGRLLDPASRQARADELARLVESVRLPSDPPEGGLARVIEKVQHGSHDVAQRLEPLLSARHPSQLYQAFTDGVVLLAVVWLVWRRPRSPGIVSVWWLFSYGIMRIVTELIRLPDADLHTPRLLGLSRGQWLSVGMIPLGLCTLAYIIRKNRPKIGGWGGNGVDAVSERA